MDGADGGAHPVGLVLLPDDGGQLGGLQHDGEDLQRGLQLLRGRELVMQQHPLQQLQEIIRIPFSLKFDRPVWNLTVSTVLNSSLSNASYFNISHKILLAFFESYHY